MYLTATGSEPEKQPPGISPDPPARRQSADAPRSGLEPEASCSVDKRAIQLRYRGMRRIRDVAADLLQSPYLLVRGGSRASLR